MPDTFPAYLVYAAAILFAALAIKVWLRYRADRRRHTRCVFCDGLDGAHEHYCQRPAGGRL